MITLDQYFSKKIDHPEVTLSLRTKAKDLLRKVNSLLVWLDLPEAIDPDTGSQISGSAGGSGDGGFRLSTSRTGVAGSPHRAACAVDVYDPGERLDAAINDDLLRRFELYREAPKATFGWAHLQTTAPRSKRRTFIP